MSAAQTIAFPSRLEQMERKAIKHLEQCEIEWKAFVTTAIEIQDSNEWMKKAKTWDEYCLKVFKRTSARIRQFRVAEPHAAVIESVTGVAVTENQIRDLRQVVKDETLLIPVFKKALEFAADNPTKRHFQAIMDVYEEAQVTQAVSVGGLSMPITEASLDGNMKEAIMEADMRFRSHRTPPNLKKWTVIANAALIEAVPELGYEALGKQVTLLWKGDSDE